MLIFTLKLPFKVQMLLLVSLGTTKDIHMIGTAGGLAWDYQEPEFISQCV